MAQARTTAANETVLDHAKKLGDDLVQVGTSVFHAGLGVVATTEEQARKTFEQLVDKGKEYGSDDSRLFARATHDAREFGQQIEQRVEKAVAAGLNRAGVPSRDEINRLSDRVEELTRTVDQLAAKRHAAAEGKHD